MELATATLRISLTPEAEPDDFQATIQLPTDWNKEPSICVAAFVRM